MHPACQRLQKGRKPWNTDRYAGRTSGEVAVRILTVLNTFVRLRSNPRRQGEDKFQEFYSGFFKSHFCNFASSVLGLIPNSSAALSGPLIFQLAVSSASKRLSRSM